MAHAVPIKCVTSTRKIKSSSQPSMLDKTEKTTQGGVSKVQHSKGGGDENGGVLFMSNVEITTRGVKGPQTWPLIKNSYLHY